MKKIIHNIKKLRATVSPCLTMYFKLLILILLSGSVLPGCSEDKDTAAGTGSILLGVDKNEVLYTKAGVAVTNEVLKVTFTNSSGAIVKTFNDYAREVKGQNIILPAGAYTVTVSSAEANAPQWDTPAYFGEEDVIVTAGQTTSASIECKITNTKVSVKFTNSVKKYFSNYEADVTGKQGTLTYLKDETRDGFYLTETLAVALRLTNKANGLNFQFDKLFTDIEPRCHYTLKFDLNSGGEGGNSGGDIDVIINKTDSTNVECTIIIPEYTQLMDIPKAPVVTVQSKLSGQNETNESTISFTKKDTNPVEHQKVTITSKTTLRNLYMKLSESFTSDNLPAMYDWLKADATIKSKLQITAGETVSGEDYTYTLDLTNMVNKYLTPNEASNKIYTLTLYAIDGYHQETETILNYTVRPDLALMTSDLSASDKWATFAVLRGICAPEGTGIQFKYGKASEAESSWQTTSGTMDSNGNVTAVVKGLSPVTNYSFKITATLNGEQQEGEAVTFQTASTPEVPNLNFDDWYKTGNHWYPNANSTIYWDSGNKGANTMSAVNPTSPEYTIVVNGTAAKLESKYVVLAFAAGNIYTGTFGSVSGLGASLNFGQPYIGKPTKLTGYYMYQPVAINHAKAPYTALSGKQDTCNIYIALTDWATPFQANTSTSTFIDFNDESILAYGAISVEEAGKSMTDYEEFSIDIVYRNTTKAPTHILIVASASKYGDYFTGGEGSTLYIDEFELHFDYNAASFAGTGSVLENK